LVWSPDVPNCSSSAVHSRSPYAAHSRAASYCVALPGANPASAGDWLAQMDRPVEAGKGAQQRVAMLTLPPPLSCSLTVASTHAISLFAWPTAHEPPTLTMRTCASSGESGGGGLGGGGEGGGEGGGGLGGGGLGGVEGEQRRRQTCRQSSSVLARFSAVGASPCQYTLPVWKRVTPVQQPFGQPAFRTAVLGELPRACSAEVYEIGSSGKSGHWVGLLDAVMSPPVNWSLVSRYRAASSHASRVCSSPPAGHVVPSALPHPTTSS
jgi:hypothetical protein